MGSYTGPQFIEVIGDFVSDDDLLLLSVFVFWKLSFDDILKCMKTSTT